MSQQEPDKEQSKIQQSATSGQGNINQVGGNNTQTFNNNANNTQTFNFWIPIFLVVTLGGLAYLGVTLWGKNSPGIQNNTPTISPSTTAPIPSP